MANAVHLSSSLCYYVDRKAGDWEMKQFAALLLAFVPLKGLRKCPKKEQMDTYLRHKKDIFWL